MAICPLSIPRNSPFTHEQLKSKSRNWQNEQQLYPISKMKLQYHLLCLTIISITLQLINSSLQLPPVSIIPTPAPWPEQFHALMVTNLSTTRLQVVDMWYDWPRGRNAYIRQQQLSNVLYGIEWNNGTTFYYTLTEPYTCDVVDYGVGILRPDFLDGANYLGTSMADGYLCNLWEKVDFIWYYEDVYTKRPVKWDFFDDISTHVITFEVGAVLKDDSLTQAPAYCFNQEKGM